MSPDSSGSDDSERFLREHEKRMEEIRRELRANERFLETGRYTDYLLEKEEDPNSGKSSFIRGFQQGCPLASLSFLLVAGILGAMLVR